MVKKHAKTTKKRSKRTAPRKGGMQVPFEGFVIIGYILGLIPYLYLITMLWVIPLTLVNVVISIRAKNKTQKFTITNAIMAILGIIPFIGFIPRVIGIVMSSMALYTIGKQGRKIKSEEVWLAVIWATLMGKY